MTTGGSGPVGTAPPDSPVPDPRGTNGRPWARLTRTAAATSAVLVGKQMTAAWPASMDASRRYSANSVGSARTRSGARAAARSAIRSVSSAEERCLAPEEWGNATARDTTLSSLPRLGGQGLGQLMPEAGTVSETR